MSAPKHTPGPWVAVEARYTLHVEGKRKKVEVNAASVVMSGTRGGPDYRRIADCRDEDIADLETDAANAHLIAAAPDLLAEVKEQRRFLVEVAGCLSNHPRIAALDALIAKVEGK